MQVLARCGLKFRALKIVKTGADGGQVCIANLPPEEVWTCFGESLSVTNVPTFFSDNLLLRPRVNPQRSVV